MLKLVSVCNRFTCIIYYWEILPYGAFFCVFYFSCSKCMWTSTVSSIRLKVSIILAIHSWLYIYSMFPFCQQLDFEYNNATGTLNIRVKLNQRFYLKLLPPVLLTVGPRHKNVHKNKPSHLSKLSDQLSSTGGRATGQSPNTAFTPFKISFLFSTQRSQLWQTVYIPGIYYLYYFAIFFFVTKRFISYIRNLNHKTKL